MYWSLLKENDDLWGVFRRLSKIPGQKFFLDSGSRDNRKARYSYAGIQPVAVLRSRGRDIECREGRQWSRWEGDPLTAMQWILKQDAASRGLSMRPFPFCGGLVGYLAYDMGKNLERLPRSAVDDIGMYDQYWGVYDTILVADHMKKQLWLAARDHSRAGQVRRTIEAALDEKDSQDLYLLKAWIGPISSNMSRERYIGSVQYVKEKIRQGDVYQVNICQRFSFPVQGPSLDIYDVLRRINPAPFAAYLHFDEYEILSMSPERFMRIEDRRIETCPIKGTRPRGRNEYEDGLMVQELLGSEKERAELLMIVDLERNDLGRLCQPGSIRVGELFAIRKYATVIHQEAEVYGILREDSSIDGVIRAAFPGGSITGAPKIAAMKIIEETEPHSRGIYTGTIGYIDYNGDCDLNIAIRTLVIKDGHGYYHAGGGLVADSDPAMEYQETLDKSKVLFLAREELMRHRRLS